MTQRSADRRQYNFERMSKLYDDIDTSMIALLLEAQGSEFEALETVSAMLTRIRRQAQQHNVVAEIDVTFPEIEEPK